MAFTYNLGASGTDLLVSKVRLEIGDSVEDSGVKPNYANFSDAEIEYMLDEEGSSVGRAAAKACEVLAAWWSRVADITVGPRREALGKVADQWRLQGKLLRKEYGGGSVGAYAYGMIKKDGYSDDITTDDVDADSEYGLDFKYYRPEAMRG